MQLPCQVVSSGGSLPLGRRSCRGEAEYAAEHVFFSSQALRRQKSDIFTALSRILLLLIAERF